MLAKFFAFFGITVVPKYPAPSFDDGTVISEEIGRFGLPGPDNQFGLIDNLGFGNDLSL